MAEDLFGCYVGQIIRKTAGSPAEYFVFQDISNSLMIDNLGSTGVYFNFDSLATTGSISGYLDGYAFRSFDLRIGSVCVLGSGALAPEVQVVRIT